MYLLLILHLVLAKDNALLCNALALKSVLHATTNGIVEVGLVMLLALPSEIILLTVESLANARDVNSLARSSKRLWHLANPLLYALFGSGSLLWAAEKWQIDTTERAIFYKIDINETDNVS